MFFRSAQVNKYIVCTGGSWGEEGYRYRYYITIYMRLIYIIPSSGWVVIAPVARDYRVAWPA